MKFVKITNGVDTAFIDEKDWKEVEKTGDIFRKYVYNLEVRTYKWPNKIKWEKAIDPNDIIKEIL